MSERVVCLLATPDEAGFTFQNSGVSSIWVRILGVLLGKWSSESVALVSSTQMVFKKYKIK